MNDYCYEKIYIGLEESFSKEISLEMEDAFRNLTGDVNPLHNNDSFAKEISRGKYTGHVAFGMLTASLYSTLAGVYLPGKYSLIHSIDNISFSKPVFAGDKLRVQGKVIDKQDDLRLIIVSAKITNQDYKTVSKAKLKIIVQK